MLLDKAAVTPKLRGISNGRIQLLSVEQNLDKTKTCPLDSLYWTKQTLARQPKLRNLAESCHVRCEPTDPMGSQAAKLPQAGFVLR